MIHGIELGEGVNAKHAVSSPAKANKSKSKDKSWASWAKQKLLNSLPVFSSADVNDLNYNGFAYFMAIVHFAVNFSPR